MMHYWFKMNLNQENSSPEVVISIDVEWKSVTFASRYDALLVQLKHENSSPEVVISTDVEWKSVTVVCRYDALLALGEFSKQHSPLTDL